MPRFVILEHDHPELHWDLMLEAGEVLQTWRLSEPPLELFQMIPAEKLPDHRRMYLDYEGPVSGNRGTVRRWDAGSYVEDVDSSAQSRRFHLLGERVQGQVEMDCIEGTKWSFRWAHAPA